MEYRVTLRDGVSPHVVVRVHEPATKALTWRFLKEAEAAARRHTLNRFLLDTRTARSRRDAVDDYDLAYRCLGELGFSRRSRVALLVAPDDESHSFFRIVACNAGYDWRLFRDECAALEWLG